MNSNDTELLPCPFCGGPAIERKAEIMAYYVECQLCENGTKFRPTPARAIEAWNTRPKPRTADSNDTEAMVKAAEDLLRMEAINSTQWRTLSEKVADFAAEQIATQTAELQKRLADAEALVITKADAEALLALHSFANQDGDFDDWMKSVGQSAVVNDLKRAIRKLAEKSKEPVDLRIFHGEIYDDFPF